MNWRDQPRWPAGTPVPPGGHGPGGGRWRDDGVPNLPAPDAWMHQISRRLAPAGTPTATPLSSRSGALDGLVPADASHQGQPAPDATVRWANDNLTTWFRTESKPGVRSKEIATEVTSVRVLRGRSGDASISVNGGIEADGRPAGRWEVTIDVDSRGQVEASIIDLRVRSGLHGLGIGTEWTRQMEGTLAGLGARRVTLFDASWDEDGHSFWERMGYTQQAGWDPGNLEKILDDPGLELAHTGFDPDVLTPAEIARELGVTRAAVSNWIARHPSFPQPVQTSAGGRRFYSLAAVRRWHETEQVGRTRGPSRRDPREQVARMTDAQLDERAAQAVAIGGSVPDTRAVHRPGGWGTPWSPERTAIHDRILARLYAQYDGVPRDRQAVMAGGLPGAGKTSVLGGMADYMPVNPDEMKDALIAEGAVPDVPGGEHLSPMELSVVYHIESSWLADRLLEMALADGRNVLIDATMGDRAGPEYRLGRLREHGYSTRGIFVDVPVDLSLQRSAARYRADMRRWAAGEGPGGRPIPARFIEQSRGGHPGGPTVNLQVFDRLAAQGMFDAGWEIHDNSGPGPVLVESDQTHPHRVALPHFPLAAADVGSFRAVGPDWAGRLVGRVTREAFTPGDWHQEDPAEHMRARRAAAVQAFVRDGISPREAEQIADDMFAGLVPPLAVYYNGPHQVVFEVEIEVPREQVIAYLDQMIADYPPPGRQPVRVSIVGPDLDPGDSWQGLTLRSSSDNRPTPPMVLLRAGAFAADSSVRLDTTSRMTALPRVPPWQYLITHEWGHVVAVGDGAQGIWQDTLVHQTFYGATGGLFEAVAEAFAEWVLSRGRTDNRAALAFQDWYQWPEPSGEAPWVSW